MTCRASIFGLGVAASVRIAAGAWLGFRPLDDAYITFRGQLAAAAGVKLPADRTNFWVDGYFEVSAGVPREPSIRVAAPEIGAVGWRLWPATIVDLEGLVTPGAVGKPPEEFLKVGLPEYLIVRTDNAAELLQALRRDTWFARMYEVVAVRRDPNAGREFRTYKRKLVGSP